MWRSSFGDSLHVNSDIKAHWPCCTVGNETTVKCCPCRSLAVCLLPGLPVPPHLQSPSLTSSMRDEPWTPAGTITARITLLSLVSVCNEKTRSLTLYSHLTGLLGGWNGIINVEEPNPPDPTKQIWVSLLRLNCPWVQLQGEEAPWQWTCG